nr:RecName: Full=Unknown protein 1 [Pinus halepensis]
VLDELTADR